ncbi:hypothetical protein TNCV_120261 [Trichonephila clavipes]|nr:hypothetical protein TNCV_120261 [Trichonephila clavipes]
MIPTARGLSQMLRIKEKRLKGFCERDHVSAKCREMVEDTTRGSKNAVIHLIVEIDTVGAVKLIVSRPEISCSVLVEATDGDSPLSLSLLVEATADVGHIRLLQIILGFSKERIFLQNALQLAEVVIDFNPAYS